MSPRSSHPWNSFDSGWTTAGGKCKPHPRPPSRHRMPCLHNISLGEAGFGCSKSVVMSCKHRRRTAPTSSQNMLDITRRHGYGYDTTLVLPVPERLTFQHATQVPHVTITGAPPTRAWTGLPACFHMEEKCPLCDLCSPAFSRTTNTSNPALSCFGVLMKV